MNEAESSSIHLRPDEFYRLSEDVQFVKFSLLPETVRKALSTTDTDYAVCRIGQRLPSLVIDNSTHELLSHFQESVRVLDVISAYAGSHNVSSKVVLQDAYPLLRKCRRAGVLRSADQPPVQVSEPVLSVGDCHAGFSVIRVVSSQVDTEVYEAQDDEGRIVALKIARTPVDPETRRQIENEVATISRIGSHISPEIRGYDIDSETPWLATTWVSGRTVEDAAAEHRARAALGLPGALIQLLVETAAAYAELHSKGVLHGDVQPLNVFVTVSGRPVIIDYGRSLETGNQLNTEERALVAYFMEPECAQDMLNKHVLPPYTERAEQFALAALLFYLATGQHYADFKLERKEMLRQITDPQPRSFEELGVQPMPGIEAVLRRALAKDSADRFPTTTKFANALRNAIPETRSVFSRGKSEFSFTQDTNGLARLAQIPLVEPTSIQEGPIASVAYGAAGIAAGLLYGAEVMDNPKLLAAADLWITKAWRDASLPGAFSAPEMGLDLSEQTKASLLYHCAGMSVTEGLIAAAMNDIPRFKHCVNTLLEHTNHNTGLPWEFAGGYAGLLVGVTLLYPTGLESTQLLAAGQQLEKRLLARIETSVGNNEFLTGNLGIAHGWAGELYAISEWRRILGVELPPSVTGCLDQLAAAGVEEGSGLTWPRNLAEDDIAYGPWWCNGSAGFVHLYCSAGIVAGSDDYINIAERAGEYTFQHSSELTDICCGLTGRAYALFRLYRVTNNSLWYERGCQLANRAVELAAISAQLPHALYKGSLGIELLKMTIENSGNIKMPLFEV